MDELKRAMDEFYDTHDHLPVLDENIIDHMNKLSKYFRIELVSSYPNVGKRVENLLYHNIDYDKLLCNVRYKCEYIKSQEKNGLEVVAIFEDAPQHIDSYLPYYPNKIWSPNFWKYLEVYFSDTRINFYSSSNDWLQIVENK